MHSLRLTLSYIVLFNLGFAFLSTKVGVHVTGIVLRGRSLKMVNPALQRRSSQAEPVAQGTLHPSFLPVLIINQTAAVLHSCLFPKVFFFLLWSQASLKQVQLLLHRAKQFMETFFKTSNILATPRPARQRFY